MPESFVAALGHENAALPLDVDWILVLPFNGDQVDMSIKSQMVWDLQLLLRNTLLYMRGYGPDAIATGHARFHGLLCRLAVRRQNLR